MKSDSIPTYSKRSGAVKTGLVLLSFVLSSGVVLGEQSPSPSASKAPNKPASTSPDKSPSPAPRETPQTAIDGKMEAELMQAEDRFHNAVLNADTKELTEILHDNYADALGRHAKKAITKRGVLLRAGKERLFAYRIEKQRKIIRSGDSFTIEGLAKAERRIRGDESPDKWFQVMRIWTNTGDRWVLNAQEVASAKEPPPEAPAEAKEKN